MALGFQFHAVWERCKCGARVLFIHRLPFRHVVGQRFIQFPAPLTRASPPSSSGGVSCSSASRVERSRSRTPRHPTATRAHAVRPSLHLIDHASSLRWRSNVPGRGRPRGAASSSRLHYALPTVPLILTSRLDLSAPRPARGRAPARARGENSNDDARRGTRQNSLENLLLLASDDLYFGFEPDWFLGSLCISREAPGIVARTELRRAAGRGPRCAWRRALLRVGGAIRGVHDDIRAAVLDGSFERPRVRLELLGQRRGGPLLQVGCQCERLVPAQVVAWRRVTSATTRAVREE